MHLLLGDARDPCCLSLQRLLEARAHETRIVSNLLGVSSFAWWLAGDRCASELAWDQAPPLLDSQIDGVLVRSIGRIDPTGWKPSDLMYMQAEAQAALLAWLWSLACPVVNRYPSAIWYQPQLPLLFWQGLLGHSGLPTLDVLVTNDEQEARTFGRCLANEGVAGAVYVPLTSDTRYLVTSPDDWRGLAAMQRYAPVCLAHPHGAAQSVCVVGEQIIWEGEPSAQGVLLEPALGRFAAAAGLAFVELALAPTSRGSAVVAVEPYPHLEHFGQVASDRIVEGLLQLLTVEVATERQRTATAQGRLA